MNDERERLAQAKTLIEQKDYEAAREILQSMSDNPTAHKWLVQIETVLARQNAPLPSDEPSAPRPKTAPPARVAADERAALMGASHDPAWGELALPPVLRPVVAALRRLGIDPGLAAAALGLAALSGLLAALLDGLLGIPGPYLSFSLGAAVALLNGPAYAIMHGRIDRGALMMAALAGLIALLFWYLLSLLTAGDANYRDGDATSRDWYAAWFDEFMSVLKAMWTGLLLGLIGLGWHALLPRVPAIAGRIMKLTGKVSRPSGGPAL